MTYRGIRPILLAAIVGAMLSSIGYAKVSPEQAARLGNELTFLGAEKSGNAEGTIPAWEGGLSYETTPGLPKVKPGKVRPDPFPDDKPLFTITSQNLDLYKEKLSPGQIAFFKKYPEWRMQVYKTRRTSTYPERIRKGTMANATTAELSKDGTHPTKMAAGWFPFPIPNNGAETILNHNYAYLWDTCIAYSPFRFVLGNGTIIDNGTPIFRSQRPLHMEGRKKNSDLFQVLVAYQSPSRRKGEMILYTDDDKNDRNAWTYVPGQRRVRRAPTISYDTPDPSTGNLATYDETYMYNGKIDRYDWKLWGKKEMFIFNNNYRADLASTEELLTPHYLNPDIMRWELHRVWVVEGTLKKDARHIYAKRVFYLDEDTWQVAATDKYDSQGNLWRLSFSSHAMLYDYGMPSTRIWNHHDLTSDVYVAVSVQGPSPRANIFNKPGLVKDRYFTPEFLRRAGRR